MDVNYIKFLEKYKGRYTIYDNISVKYIVISADTFFYHVYEICLDTQIDMFKCNDKKSNCIYLNNYIIFVDTILRMLTLSKNILNDIKKIYKYETIILLNDIKNVPKRYFVYSDKLNKYLPEDILYSISIQYLKKLSKYLPEDELSDYDSWEEYLCKRFKREYDFSLHHSRTKFDDKIEKYKAINNFMHVVSLIQMQLTDKEKLIAWKYVFNELSKEKNVKAFECKNKIFDPKIMSIFNNERVIVITRRCIKANNVFIYNFKDLYYPKLCKDINENELDKDAKLTKYKSRNISFLKLFDVCEQECMNRILDINDYMNTSIFKDLNALYVKNKVDVVKSDYVNDSEYSWVTKEYVAEFIVEVIQNFNKTFGFNIIM